MSHRKHKKIDKPKGSALAVYWRMMRTYAFRYWGALLIGVLSAVLMGGSFRASLSAIDMGLGSYSAQRKVAMERMKNAENPAGDGAELVDAASATGNDAPSVDDVVAGEVAPPQVPQDRNQVVVDKVNDYIQKAENWLAKCGIECKLERIDLNQNLTFGMLQLLVAGALIFILLRIACNLVNRYALRWLSARVVADMRAALYEKLLHQSMTYYSQTDVGKLMSRCTNDTATVEMVIASSIPDLTTAPLMILASVQFIWQKAVDTGLGMQTFMTLVALPVGIIPIFLFSKLLKQYQHSVLKRISSVTSRMQEGFSGIHVIRAFNTEDRESGYFRLVNEKYFKSVRKAILADECVHPIMQLSAIMLAIFFMVICYRSGISLGTVAIVGFAMQQAFRPLKDLAQINSAMQRSAAAAERIFEIVDMKMELPEKENPVKIEKFEKEIRFNGVSFSYNGQYKVLDDVNLTIPKGKMIALVGQTGSGKTTMANLLARFYDPDSGSITMDGHDLRDLEVASFRKLVGVVSQDTFLFNENLEYNIKYGRPEVSYEEMLAAAEQANATQFIKEFPEGFQRMAGERGSALSGGQKQRIAIARAIIRNPPILILDEATSALDTVTERLVQDALDNVMKNRTILVIAHRLSTIKKADIIVVMDHGRIVEMGTDEELIAMNGYYKKLNDIQFKSEG